ncbi:hypothetical protein B0I35DRAFT_422472 [Stachybotrys elegans]|uniref:Fork-head domain-containing protein n=1 Tax=Stachybotrys elegans TaxID=80388 RepID=A0A8K0T3C3_9HYPO|nr:hypothetical protein B0I35DRAFT_422472 [Stachybotrys elegans]
MTSSSAGHDGLHAPAPETASQHADSALVTLTATATLSASEPAAATSTAATAPAPFAAPATKPAMESSTPTDARPHTPLTNPINGIGGPSTDRRANDDAPQGAPPSALLPEQDQPMPDAPDNTTASATVAGPSTSENTQSQRTDGAMAHTPIQQRPEPRIQMPQQNANMSTDQFPPSTPFTPVSISNMNPQTYMMMALASMSAAAPNAMSPPPTVTPSQVTLPNPMDEAFHGLAPAHTLRQSGGDKGLESFARIEFADSVFQMTTYAVIIGRDQRALEQARRDEKRGEEHKRRVEENASKGLPPPSPIALDRSKFSKSYVSEEGGMLGPESDSEENGRPAKRRKTSTAGSSQHDNEEAQENIISNRQYVSHTPGAAAVDLTSLRPSPWHVPFIGIHSPGPNIASKTKAISREHLKIAYNQEEGVFEAIPLHKNGFFCEDVHYKSDKVVLKSGDRLQIKDIDFRFIINGVERGLTGAEDYDEKIVKKRRGGKEMSFDFEQSHGNGDVQDTSDELSDVEVSPPELSDFGEEDAEEAEPTEEPGPEEAGEEEETSIATEAGPIMDPMMPQIPRKRGPGRPPKNGFMSKREQRLLKKQAQEMARKTLPQGPPVEPPIKRKVGRPRKHPLPENAEGSEAERRAKEKKEKKARPKSPPLELKIEDYTEEQLQKPNKNYGVLIDETLTAAGPDGLTLKQIYKRICQRYPWFHFHTETKGWESSVRHNLIGNEAFKKDETTNLWSRVPGVELDAGKKRKASSPDRALAAQGYGPYSYPYNAQAMAPGAPAYPPGQVPPGYQVPAGYPGQPPQVSRPPQQQQQYGEPAPAAGQPLGPGPGPAPANATPQQPQAAPQLGSYGPPPAPARAQPGAQPNAYSSPYAARPPPPANVPIKSEDGTPPVPMPGPSAQPAPAPLHSAPQPTPAPAPASSQPGPSTQASQPVAVPPHAGSPAATPPVTTGPRPVMDTRLLAAIVNLKKGLLENLRKARNPTAEVTVMSAVNRCIGLKKEVVGNDKMEDICTRGIGQIINAFLDKQKSPTPGPSGTPAERPHIFEPKILASLNGFRDVSVKALKEKLGEARAEAVALSAIDRVLGLADASIVPSGVEGETQTPGNLEGVEQHLIKSLRQLLIGMNQKLPGN